MANEVRRTNKETTRTRESTKERKIRLSKKEWNDGKKQQQTKLTIEMEKINQKIRDSKDTGTGSNNTNKTKHSKITKGNSTNRSVAKPWQKISNQMQRKQSSSWARYGNENDWMVK